MTLDPYLLVRAASLYVTAIMLSGIWIARRPGDRAVAGAALATAWNVPFLLVLNVAAQRFGWWQFDATGGLLLGMPLDLYVAWVMLWGAIPALLFPTTPLAGVVFIALAFDLATMPQAAPVLRLGAGWLPGEAVGLVSVLLPAQLLARWTIRRERLAGRAILQMIAFGGLVFFLIPTIAVVASGSAWANPVDRPSWLVSVMVQVLVMPALLGVTAVQEFVTRGGGTPVPFDPPVRMVTSGIYAYLRNPMQLSGVVMLLFLGAALANPYVAAAGLLAHVYSVGIAGWDEDEDLRRRFGDSWVTYRRSVRSWIPRWRPWHSVETAPAKLFVAASCGMCSEVGAWFQDRGARHIVIVAAETHPSRALVRITYEPADGSDAASGVAALARALEHIHLGWAMLAFAIRLPGVATVVQLFIDASGGAPRPAQVGSSRRLEEIKAPGLSRPRG